MSSQTRNDSPHGTGKTAAGKGTATKNTTAKNTAAKNTAAKNATSKNTTAKNATAKNATAKKTAAKSTAKRRSSQGSAGSRSVVEQATADIVLDDAQAEEPVEAETVGSAEIADIAGTDGTDIADNVVDEDDVDAESLEETEEEDDAGYDEADVDAHPMPTGWRHRSTWLYIVDLVTSFAAIVASFILSADALYSARHPDELLNCDINAKVSCSTVAQSWQAELIKLGNLSFPNAFFGICAESVFITIAVLGIARVIFPRWFTFCAWLGNLAALAYAYWLLSQSLFVINALCPWCILLMFSTTIQFMAFSHATVTVQGMPAHPRRLATYYRLGIDLLVDVVWIVAIVAVILAVDGSAIFS